MKKTLSSSLTTYSVDDSELDAVNQKKIQQHLIYLILNNQMSKTYFDIILKLQ